MPYSKEWSDLRDENQKLKEEIQYLKQLLEKKNQEIEQHIKGKERVMVKNG
jgi:hypothetical protein